MSGSFPHSQTRWSLDDEQARSSVLQEAQLVGGLAQLGKRCLQPG